MPISVTVASRLRGLARSEALLARALRGSALTALGFAGGQALRLAGNLVLTRLLFPEAFGLMALVTVFMVGLSMLSDVGLGPAIHQSPRGDEPRFLGTAWTIQAIRGAVLFAAACAIAPLAAAFYGVPELAGLLSVSGLTLLVAGLTPIRQEVAVRHLRLGRLTAIDLAVQTAGLAVTILLALLFRSVWALVVGNVVGALLRLALIGALLPGPRVRATLDAGCARDLIRFGKWVFLSTLCAFLVAQGDKAILGRVLSLEELGIYNIGFFLAAFPQMLGVTLASRVLIPIYRESFAQADRAAAMRRMRRMRAVLTLLLMLPLVPLAFFATPVVEFLYDPRYAAAAGVLCALAAINLVQVVGVTYDQAALAAGNSRGFFIVMAGRTLLQTAAFLAGFWAGGLPGALAAYGLSILLVHAMIVGIARHHRVWDPLHDALALAAVLPLAALALAENRAALAALAGFGG
jgi:O-antigen/teichoic acid export membrane protein